MAFILSELFFYENGQINKQGYFLLCSLIRCGIVSCL